MLNDRIFKTYNNDKGIGMKKSLLVTFALVITLFSGCANKTPELDGSSGVLDSGYGKQGGLGTAGALGSDANIDNMGSMDGMDSSTMDGDLNSFGSQDERVGAVQNEVQTVYFATDSYRLSPAEMDKITQNSSIFNGELASDLVIKIEGNCDEWGTDEYNYALGLKRAKSAKNSLVQSGVNEGRMSLVSFGESKPICSEHNDGCWQQNRRVDFKLFP
jgi:peptidoglycan-associated lipoprotein